ncbi:MAG: inorganic phosphate transporter [Rikenellaceae bacterium]
MDSIYVVILTILMALAVSDLVVGVSNDAVNFLNSAIGSKAAPRWTIMLIASVGILIGAVFSTGMMEVARSGIFFPGQFTFHDVMLLFLAVMFTDVILLDTFNSIGLPTSTTVSLVFELMGAAVAVALTNIWSSGGSLVDYINASKALGIISGILLSVVISFTTGIIVMFVSRVIFTFSYKKTVKYIGALWCGFALTAISYFAVFKGLKDTSLMNADAKLFLSENTFLILAGSMVVWTLLMAVCQYLFRLNILKITVLAGTLSLALAFAGNDLVNFIGVSMAGVSSYDIASAHVAAGGDLATLKMSALEGDVTVQPLYLIIAGLIMIVTLWFSKKARTVTETEINLARQDNGDERFGSTLLSRVLVKSAYRFNQQYMKWAPRSVQNFVNKRFTPVVDNDADKAPFDLIRATVNLTSASILIAIATSLKLPLSTTYVTFMVAMGTSLSDRAWGRESAVYRITGVLTVIGGWFMTAIIAFTVAFLIALILISAQEWAIYGLAIVCAVILIQSKILYKRRQQKKESVSTQSTSFEMAVIEKANEDICESMQRIISVYNDTLTGLVNEDLRLLKQMVRETREMHSAAEEKKMQLLPIIKKLQANNIEVGHFYVQVIDYLGEVANALLHITVPSFDHINNLHSRLTPEQIADLRNIGRHVDSIYIKINQMLKSNNYDDLDETLMQRDELFGILVEATKNQVRRVIDKDTSSRGSILYLSIINETKTMVLQSRNLLKAQKLFNSSARR